jgi:hypothetical protein
MNGRTVTAKPPLVLAYAKSARAPLPRFRILMLAAYLVLGLIVAGMAVDVRAEHRRNCRELNALREPIRFALGYAVMLSIDSAESAQQKTEARTRNVKVMDFYTNELKEERC